MASLGEFLSNDQNKKQENERMMKEWNDKLDSGILKLIEDIREWLKDEIVKKAVTIEMPFHAAIPDINSPLKIKTSAGIIEISKGQGFYLGSNGHVDLKNRQISKDKAIPLSPVTLKWMIRKERKNIHDEPEHIELTGETFSEILIGLLSPKR